MAGSVCEKMTCQHIAFYCDLLHSGNVSSFGQKIFADEFEGHGPLCENAQRWCEQILVKTALFGQILLAALLEQVLAFLVGTLSVTVFFTRRAVELLLALPVDVGELEPGAQADIFNKIKEAENRTRTLKDALFAELDKDPRFSVKALTVVFMVITLYLLFKKARAVAWSCLFAKDRESQRVQAQIHAEQISAGADQATRNRITVFFYGELAKATQNFAEEMCIGSGGFGTVYKASGLRGFAAGLSWACMSARIVSKSGCAADAHDDRGRVCCKEARPRQSARAGRVSPGDARSASLDADSAADSCGNADFFGGKVLGGCRHESLLPLIGFSADGQLPFLPSSCRCAARC
eukprot:701566-Rhodomonas_salina.1